MTLLHIAVFCFAIGLSLAACGGNLKGPKGGFTSPNYPNEYPDNADCTWNIEVEKGKAIRLTFPEFELENRVIGTCPDYVKIVDSATSKEIGTYCASENPGTVYSSENGLRVEFKTDESITYRGFEAQYEAIDKKDVPPTTTAAPTITTTEAPTCGGMLSGSDGEFTSPNYPNEYPNDISCSWSISVDPGKRIKLSFSDFELENAIADECPDYVKIVDPATSNEIGTYCGAEKPPTTYSSGHRLRVEFKTDVSDTFRGFKARYEAINETEVPPSTTAGPTTPPTTTPTTTPTPTCGGSLSAQDGEFTSPNYPNQYPNNIDCTWTIEVDKSNLIKLSFSDFELEDESGGDCVDYVKVIDPATSRIVGTYCGDRRPPITYSSSNQLRVEFKTDVSDTFRGFKARYQAINETDIPPTPAPCITEVTADSGFVTSPNYPKNYPDQTNCAYIMRLATGGQISLEFADFQLEHDNACKNDYVTIHDGDNVGAKQIGRFCGTPTARLVASGDVIFMRFVSDVQDNFRGFNATFKKATCENMGGSCSASCSNGAVEWACGAGLQCCLPKLLPDKCGERPNGLLEGVHIVGGEPAKPNSWPWQVSLQTNTGFHYCGAVLFSDQWVVTAAHCVQDETTVNLVLGEHNRNVVSGKELRLKASKIVIHPEFINSSPWPNDIALLKLDAPLKPSPYYSPVCMPDDPDQPFMPEDTCYMTGWGDTKGTGDSTILNELLIKPQTNANCKLMWGEDSIKDTNICVGTGEVGSCQGDSGGPFVCKKKNGWVLAGVTSWGVRGCRTRGAPSVYTRISKFLDWTRKNIV